MKIPPGKTRTYAWVAEKIGKPKATRAVAQALHRNPWPLIIPCHRVVASDGSIGGYAYGISLKKLLLLLEKKNT
jgi:O-6-methylguanine DNA methyltransferase